MSKLYCRKISIGHHYNELISSVNMFVLHQISHDSYTSILDCAHPAMIGDGCCNDESNNPECGYDGGDCCGSCINTDYCTNCTCIGDVTGNGVPNALVGDGFCNDETNIAGCNYDGGDCCQNFELIGNGFCNDDANNAECNYDGGDCCGPDISCK